MVSLLPLIPHSQQIDSLQCVYVSTPLYVYMCVYAYVWFEKHTQKPLSVFLHVHDKRGSIDQTKANL